MPGYGIEGETALVVGGTRGLGLSCAAALAEVGVRVIINGRDRAVGEAAAAQLGRGAGFLFLDGLAQHEGANLLEADSAGGPISIVVTNAGGPPPGPFVQASPEAWQSAFTTSVLAAIEVVRFFLSGMTQRRFGRVVNTTSFVVTELYPNMALSNTMRIALTGAMATLAREVMEHGITVNNILPGLMDTGALQRVISD